MSPASRYYGGLIVCPACHLTPEECGCSVWCTECECWTNHTTADHDEAEAERGDDDDD